MEKELDPDLIKATQTSLGKYVKRPPLSEKLLRKPPFRFLHDIVTSVLKTTGFFEGLFEPEELISDNVKDRESKILFLNKVVAVIGFSTGKTLAIKPSKIVAGQEADKTNELLQTLALALDKKISSEEAVKKFKENGNLQQTTDKKTKESTKSVKVKKSVDSKKFTSKSNEKLTSKKNDPGRGLVKNVSDVKNSTKTIEKDSTKNESPPKKITQQTKSSKGGVEKKVSQKSENVDVAGKVNVINTKTSTKKVDDESDNQNVNLAVIEEPISIPDEPSGVFDKQPESEFSSAAEYNLNSLLSSKDLIKIEDDKLSRNQFVENNRNIDNETNKSLDPKSPDDVNSSNDYLKNSTDKDVNITFLSTNDQVNNLNANEKIVQKDFISDVKKDGFEEIGTVPKSPEKYNNPVNTRPKSVRPSSSRPGAPRLRDKHENILTESENLIVGKVNIIAENTPLEEEEDSSMIIVEQEQKSLQTHVDLEQFQLSSKPHGHLVQQILDSQKEFSQVAGKTEIEWEFGAQKAREAVNKEIEQLRFNIQGLSRVANPLGKILDHIQEDVEVMRQELQQWTKSYDDASKELLKQKTINEDSLLPLRSKVKKLEVDINEKLEKINDLKVVIHKNSSRIDKLLASGDVQ